jgi:hypothetical protein
MWLPPLPDYYRYTKEELLQDNDAEALLGVLTLEEKNKVHLKTRTPI